MEIDMKHTDDTLKKMVDMWANNYTSSQIAKELCLTRNTVMGMIYRMKLKGLVDPLSHKVVAKPKPEPKRNPKPVVEKKGVSTKRTPPIFIKPKPVGHVPLTLMQLKNSSCRYAVNDGHASQFLFCGKPKEKGSYCMEHANLCYIKPHKGVKKEKEKMSSFALKQLMPGA
jgi:GcrA cell cycle regulator